MLVMRPQNGDTCAPLNSKQGTQTHPGSCSLPKPSQLSSRWDSPELPRAFHRNSAGPAASPGTGLWCQQWEDGPCTGGSSEDPQSGRGGSRASQQPLPAPCPRCHRGVGDACHCQGTESHCCFICHPLVRDGQELSVLTCFSALKIGSGWFLGLG